VKKRSQAAGVVVCMRGLGFVSSLFVANAEAAEAAKEKTGSLIFSLAAGVAGILVLLFS
jgi:hypothetical protein